MVVLIVWNIGWSIIPPMVSMVWLKRCLAWLVGWPMLLCMWRIMAQVALTFSELLFTAHETWIEWPTGPTWFRVFSFSPNMVPGSSRCGCRGVTPKCLSFCPTTRMLGGCPFSTSRQTAQIHGCITGAASAVFPGDASAHWSAFAHVTCGRIGGDTWRAKGHGPLWKSSFA